MVATGAALYVLLSIELTKAQGDSTRIIGQVVTGVGFLGAGIIFKEGSSVHGLTTAATVWCSSALGCLAAAGYYGEAYLAAVAIIAVNTLMKPLDDWLVSRGNNKIKDE